jgi:hypothetical protein
VIGKLRRERKDLFAVGFKTTAGADEDGMYAAGMNLLKVNGLNLVLVNDLHTRANMVLTPELARYHVTREREEALAGLVEMAWLRHGLTFSRTRVISGELLRWTDPAVPESLRAVVDHCVARGAYRPFNDVTVGHFGFRDPQAHAEGRQAFWSSRRKRNFNRSEDRDLVHVTFQQDGSIGSIAEGAKPSAGARSQYEVLSRYEEFDCVVHFHCPARPDAPSPVPVRAQRPFECGSHECGRNTAEGLVRFGRLGAVMLDQHGPNVVFSRSTPAAEVIAFIDAHFDLEKQTSAGE